MFEAVKYGVGAIWVAIWTSSVSSSQTNDMFVVLPLIGTPVPKHFMVYFMLFGTLISVFGFNFTVARLVNSKVFQALDKEEVVLFWVFS